MAGETAKCEAICLDIRPWSRTSHVVGWLTPHGRVTTVVKGAERPKGAFLGAYDLNYTCEIVYYARAKREIHALRECTPLRMREGLRGDYRALATAGYFRSVAADLSPAGTECANWFRLLDDSLDRLAGGAGGAAPSGRTPNALMSGLLEFELAALGFAGLAPDFSNYDRNAEWSRFSVENGTFSPDGAHPLRISREVSEFLGSHRTNEKNMQILLDAARVIGVFYSFHLDCAPDVRRSVLGLICNKKETNENG